MGHVLLFGVAKMFFVVLCDFNYKVALRWHYRKHTHTKTIRGVYMIIDDWPTSLIKCVANTSVWCI